MVTVNGAASPVTTAGEDHLEQVWARAHCATRTALRVVEQAANEAGPLRPARLEITAREPVGPPTPRRAAE